LVSKKIPLISQSIQGYVLQNNQLQCTMLNIYMVQQPITPLQTGLNKLCEGIRFDG